MLAQVSQTLLLTSYHSFVYLQHQPEPENRAPRHTLTGYTALDKVQRRKRRARVYSNSARERSKALHDQMQHDVQGLRPFHAFVDCAPHIVLVLSDDLGCRILYANAAVNHILHTSVESMLGRCVIVRLRDSTTGCRCPYFILFTLNPSCLIHHSSLAHLVHPDDKPNLLRMLAAVILAGEGQNPRRLRLRIQTTYPDHYIRLDVRFRYGLQGIHCTLWATADAL